MVSAISSVTINIKTRNRQYVPCICHEIRKDQLYFIHKTRVSTTIYYRNKISNAQIFLMKQQSDSFKQRAKKVIMFISHSINQLFKGIIILDIVSFATSPHGKSIMLYFPFMYSCISCVYKNKD